MTRISYLEISPRQSGKTARLIKKAATLSRQGHTVVYVSPGLDEERQTALRRVGVIVRKDGETLPKHLDEDRAVWFYDEFDWLKCTTVRMGGYYATTAKRLRDPRVDSPESDMLLALLKANGYSHERHFIPLAMRETLAEMRLLYRPEEFRLFCLGEFMQ
ncbi:hypothetical protein ACM7HL_12705 [Pseudomonas aeruginosa]